MEGLYPAMIFVALAVVAVWWLVRTRDALAMKRVVAGLKQHITEEVDRAANRVIAASRAASAPTARKRRIRSSSPSDYPRDSNEG